MEKIKNLFIWTMGTLVAIALTNVLGENFTWEIWLLCFSVSGFLAALVWKMDDFRKMRIFNENEFKAYKKEMKDAIERIEALEKRYEERTKPIFKSIVNFGERLNKLEEKVSKLERN